MEFNTQGAMTHFAFLYIVPPALALLAMIAAARAEEKEGPEPSMVYNNACRTCHSMKEGDNRQGPSLHGVVGRKAGTLAGFQFSPSMQNSGVVWDEATLDKFIADPDQVVNGNGMKPYGGIDDADQRKEIIAFLKSISGK
jgi:cytochrome c